MTYVLLKSAQNDDNVVYSRGRQDVTPRYQVEGEKKCKVPIEVSEKKVSYYYTVLHSILEIINIFLAFQHVPKALL